MTLPIRIAVLHFAHETVSFLKNDTTTDDFIYQGSPASGEALLKVYPKSYMGGFVKVAREFAGVELVGIAPRRAANRNLGNNRTGEGCARKLACRNACRKKF